MQRPLSQVNLLGGHVTLLVVVVVELSVVSK